MQEAFRGARTPVVAVGFSPPEPLAELAGVLGWSGPFLSDEQRVLYRLLALPRAGLLRTYSPRTMLRYSALWVRGKSLPLPVEDTRQLGGDALVLDGVVRVLWRPRTPADRVDPALIAATLRRLTARA